MSFADELDILLKSRSGQVTKINENHFMYAPSDNVCVIDITFDDQIIHIVGKDMSDNKISVSIRRPNERLIHRFGIALDAVITPMRQLRDLINPPN